MVSAQVTVIIPTLCGSKRAMELVRAIASVNAQQNVAVETLVVVNGHWFEPSLLQTVTDTQGVSVLMLDTPGISHARLQGRKRVTTPYFLFLDDDDELYPHALVTLLATFDASDSDTGLVVADAYNDYRCGNYGFYPSPAEIERDPLDALLGKNWLIAQSALFKTARAPVHLFDIQTVSNECTMIAFNLAREGIKVRVNEKVLAVVHDKVDSESKSEHFITQETRVIQWMLTQHVPPAIQTKLRRKLASAFHSNSVFYLDKKMFRKAVVAHVRSLLIPDGDNYALYGRHILVAILTCWKRPAA
jgi:glycosyltransferase involved in cell wall biosynthesis